MKKKQFHTYMLLKLRTLVAACFVLGGLFLQSCSKDHDVTLRPDDESSSGLVTIKAAYEPIINAATGTKITINENPGNFYLRWTGSESLSVTTSTNTAYSNFTFLSQDPQGVATFSGTLPSAGSAITTSYVATTSDAFKNSSKSYITGKISTLQNYTPDNNAKYAFIVAHGDETTPGTMEQPLMFKTMNSFLKFSLKKGSSLGSNVYDKMYLLGITLESINGESLSGNFAIEKTENDYEYSAAASGSSKVVLNCKTASYPKGVELSSADASDFYLAVAFGTFAGGFKVTLNVANESGDQGVMTKTIASSSGKTLVRNRLYTTPELTVSPSDVGYSYVLISELSEITTGQYYIGGDLEAVANQYEIWTGAISGSNDMVTSSYIYNPSTMQLTGGSNADLVTITQKPGGYYIIQNSAGNYLYSTSYTEKRALALTASEGTAAKITFSENAGHGGFAIVLTNPSNDAQNVIVSTNTSAGSNYLRSYASNVYNGVHLFKKVYGAYTGDSTSGNSDNPSDPAESAAYGYLELPTLPSASDIAANNYQIYTLRATMNGIPNVRNYSALYYPDYYAQLWTAYPLHKSHMGTVKRPNSWYWNGEFSNSLQTNLCSSAYGVNVTTSYYSPNYYARGHQIPNADRNGIADMQRQTFYVTNSTPQIQNGFNGGMWQALEDALQSEAKSYSDTLYIVTGPVYRKAGGSEVIKNITNTNDSKVIAVPNYYFKAVLKVKRTDGVITSASAIGFWFEHRDYGTSRSYSSYTVSVSTLESYTGFNLFAALPPSVASSAEANTSWAAFQAF